MYVDGMPRTLTVTGNLLDRSRTVFRIVPAVALCADAGAPVVNTLTTNSSLAAPTGSSVTAQMTVSPLQLLSHSSPQFKACVWHGYGAPPQFSEFTQVNGSLIELGA